MSSKLETLFESGEILRMTWEGKRFYASSQDEAIAII